MKEQDQKGIELSKKDNDQLELRKALIIAKQREMQQLQLEAQIFTKEYQDFAKGLFKKYDLDDSKEYTIADGTIIEVEATKIDKQDKKEE